MQKQLVFYEYNVYLENLKFKENGLKLVWDMGLQQPLMQTQVEAMINTDIENIRKHGWKKISFHQLWIFVSGLFPRWLVWRRVSTTSSECVVLMMPG